MDNKLRIMHGPSEIAGQNSNSVKGLKKIGEFAESVSFYKHPFAYDYDTCLNIDKSKKKLWPFYAVKLACFFIKAMFRYNTFHFHYGHSILNCHELFLYRLFNKRFFFEFHGSDLRDYKKYCEITGTPYEAESDNPQKIHNRNKKICENADGIIVHDDELLPYLPKKHSNVYVVPLRVDLSKFDIFLPENNDTIRIVHAPSKRAGKGTKFVLEAYEILKEKYNNIELVLVEGKTQQEAFEIYKTADIIVDQLYAGTYGVFAIEGMALGKPVISFISDEMKERLPEELPIVSANINTIGDKLELLIKDYDLRYSLGIQGRQYAETYHDYSIIAYLLREIYKGDAIPKKGREAFEHIKLLANKHRL